MQHLATLKPFKKAERGHLPYSWRTDFDYQRYVAQLGDI